MAAQSPPSEACVHLSPHFTAAIAPDEDFALHSVAAHCLNRPTDRPSDLQFARTGEKFFVYSLEKCALTAHPREDLDAWEKLFRCSWGEGKGEERERRERERDGITRERERERERERFAAVRILSLTYFFLSLFLAYSAPEPPPRVKVRPGARASRDLGPLGREGG